MVNNSTNEDSERLYLNDEDCNSIFQIPSHLVESYGVNLPSKALLRVDDSGRKWKVSIEKFKDVYFFTNGWKEFAEQVDLKSLDWLKFKSSSSSKQTGTNKEKTRKRSGDVNGTISSMPNENKDKCSSVETKLSFTKKMKNYNRNRLVIPKKFALGTGMREGEKIKLKDSEGRVRPVHVTERAGVFSMCRGWSSFVNDNKNTLMVGSKISITWLSGNMLQAQIVEVGTDKQPLCTATQNSRGKHLQNPHSDNKKSGDINATSSIMCENKGEGSSAEKKLSFCKEMKKHHQHCLDIPQDFSMGIGLHKDREIKLTNGEGRVWPVRVIKRVKNRNFTICGGWTDFVIDNKVMLGSTISFTWLSGNMVQTQIVEVGTDKQPLSSTIIKRGNRL